MPKIKLLEAEEILDSRGSPTVGVRCVLESGKESVASVPSGKSVGAHEAFELRDKDPERYFGAGVLKAVSGVNEEISKAVIGKDFTQKTLDDFLINLDSTKNKSRLGANAILAVSLAFARAAASEKNVELYEYLGGLVNSNSFALPVPAFNVINGGKHSDSGLDIQEFLLIPIGVSGFRNKVEAGVEIIATLKESLVKSGYSVGLGDEGGFAPKLARNEEAIDLLVSAIKDAGYSTSEIKIGLDVASSSFYKNGKYNLKIDGKDVSIDSIELISWYEKLVNDYPIISIEDGLSEDDWDGFKVMNEKLGDKITIVGDDLLTTNVERIKTAIDKKAVNSVLIKPNQIGSLSETIDAIMLAKSVEWKPFMSHRSGETNDTFIADLAVGLSCDYIKSGSLAREERIAKYNRLMEIADKIEK